MAFVTFDVVDVLGLLQWPPMSWFIFGGGEVRDAETTSAAVATDVVLVVSGMREIREAENKSVLCSRHKTDVFGST